MLKKKTQKLAVLIASFFIFSILALTFNINFQVSDQIYEPRNNFDTLKISATYFDIEIDALATTNTTTSGNWTWAKDNGYCTGFGTPASPYIIENQIFEYSSGSGDCLRILDSREYFIIRNCNFRNSDILDSGLYLYNVTNGKIINSFAYNCLRGIELSFVNNSELTGNHVYDNNEGIRLSNSYHNTISNNNASLNGDGIVLISNSDNNVVSGNTASFNSQNGIDISSCEDLTIHKNKVDSNTLNGISLGGGNNIICTSNTVYENKQNGILLDNTDDCDIENNNAHHNGFDGIRLSTMSQWNVIKSNVIQYNNLSGIYVYFNSHNNLIMNNLATNNKEHGLFLESSNNAALTGNTASNNDKDGIHLLSSNSNSILSNTANNNENGAFLDNSDNNIVANNKFLGNQVCYNETGSTGNIFENNVCTAGLPIIDTVTLSIVLLIFVIIESAALGAIVAMYFMKKRKPKP